ncbi:MAG: hypothetical protein MJ252_14250 [archaeon]|nr:hypothetical protein [archaeon]
MGCSSSMRTREELFKDNYLEKTELFKRAKDLINEMEVAVDEYEKYKKDYIELLNMKQEAEVSLRQYFKKRGETDLRNEPELIANKDEIFNKINKIGDKLQINKKALNLEI